MGIILLLVMRHQESLSAGWSFVLGEDGIEDDDDKCLSVLLLL